MYLPEGRKPAVLVLADGTVFEGLSIGAEGEFFGEVCFNTSMLGYQEILTDPSYEGQIVAMTYPLIGNYGVNDRDMESGRAYMGAFLVRESSRLGSNWRSTGDLETLLCRFGVVGMEGLDTRALTIHIRDRGAMQGGVSTIDTDPDSVLERVTASPGLVGRDLVREVTVRKPYRWPEGDGGDADFNVVVLDFGIKRNTLRLLADSRCAVMVVPADTPASRVMELGPDGIILSSGPGDPGAVTYAVETARSLLGKRPVFGICLGHQLLALALGGRTYKMKFGHRGANQPVMNCETGRVEITAQNHGFAVDTESLGSCRFGDVELTHYNLNDHTSEGVSCPDVGAFSVQYHPEAAPGPHDSRYLFDRFVDCMREWR